MSARVCIVGGALLAGLGVVMGSYHAHGLDTFLKARITDAETVSRQMDNFGSAVRYQMYHAIGLVLVGLVAARRQSVCTSVAAWAFAIGIALFSGLLYAIVFGGPKYLGAIVPFGGGAMIAGWVALAVAGWRIDRS